MTPAPTLAPAQHKRHLLPPDCPLSVTELEIIGMLADGLVYKEIALRRGCSATTVRSHLNNAYHRLGAVDRAQAVIVCFRAGWLNPQGLPTFSPPPPAPRTPPKITPGERMYLAAFDNWLRDENVTNRAELDFWMRVIRREAAAPDLPEHHAPIDVALKLTDLALKGTRGTVRDRIEAAQQLLEQALIA